jgi:hypothetical protein
MCLPLVMRSSLIICSSHSLWASALFHRFFLMLSLRVPYFTDPRFVCLHPSFVSSVPFYSLSTLDGFYFFCLLSSLSLSPLLPLHLQPYITFSSSRVAFQPVSILLFSSITVHTTPSCPPLHFVFLRVPTSYRPDPTCHHPSLSASRPYSVC